MVALIVASWSPPADACEYSLGFMAARSRCEPSGELPANAIIDERERDVLPEQTRALFEPATDVDARFASCARENALGGDLRCLRFHRLRTGTPAGTPVRSEARGECGIDQLTEATPDVTPPSTPIVADVVLDLVTDPAGTGCYTCPDVDTMTIFVTSVQDDRTSPEMTFLALYVGATEEEARTRTTIDHLLPAQTAVDVGVGPKRRIDSTNGPAFAIRAAVGESVDRERRIDEGIFKGGPRCVAVETMDRGGNLSARSNVMCFDHTSESDPGVRTEDGSCACTTHGGPRASSVLLTILTAAFVVASAGSRRPTRTNIGRVHFDRRNAGDGAITVPHEVGSSDATSSLGASRPGGDGSLRGLR